MSLKSTRLGLGSGTAGERAILQHTLPCARNPVRGKPSGASYLQPEKMRREKKSLSAST